MYIAWSSLENSSFRRILISSALADALGKTAERLVSVGGYALCGVSGAQHLFTLDPGGDGL
jgi:orotate phosphoribosyltransferase-like protein